MQVRGTGSAAFAAILLIVAGTLNVIYGIAAVDNASFFVNGTHYAFGHLHTWGWITIILGAIQLIAGFSLMGGGAFGRVIGIIGAGLGAIASLLAIGDSGHPFWSLGIFAICIIVLHGLFVYGEPKQT